MLTKKFKSNLSIKVFFTITLLLLTACLCIYLIVMLLLPRTYYKSIASQFDIDFTQLVDDLEGATEEEAQVIINKFIQRTDSEVFLLPEGSYETDKYEVNYILEEGDGEDNLKTITAGRTDDQDLISSHTIIFDGSDTPTNVVVNTSTASVEAVSDILWTLLPWIIVTILFISFMGSLMATFYFTKPVIRISSIAKKMSSQDMTWRCEINRTDEIGELADSLNVMAEDLDGAMTDLKNANARLQKDIERERLQEKQRKNFFSAVSHELKTPITILKGQLESMILRIGVYKDRDKYLQESLETTENMEKLVKEILMISKMETDELSLNTDSIQLKDIVEECCRQYEVLASEKNQILHQDLQADLKVTVNRRLMKKAVSNIINNAISYSPAGEHIYVLLKEKEGKSILSVENTGAALNIDTPQELFTPFYRMDKSRNRKTGGSGLGLYLVKSILELHQLNYCLENTDRGVRFTIELPIPRDIENSILT